MEKGFNDDELADIMNEIESLEKEFTDETGDSSQTEIVDSYDNADSSSQDNSFESDTEEDEFVAQSQEEEFEEPVNEDHDSFADEVEIDDEVHEVLDELAEMPVEKAIPPQHKEQPQQNVHPMHKSSGASSEKGAHSSLSFNIQGEMSVHLSFNIAGKEVSLHVNEGEGLVIAVGGGAKFILPVQEADSHKKVA